MTKNCWVVFADVYGFSALVKRNRNSLSEILSRVDSANKIISERIHNETRAFFLSDNFFLVVDADSFGAFHAFEILIADLRHAISAYMQNELPLRGAIAYGRVSVSNNMLIGEPIIRAVGYERRFPAPLIFMPQVEARAANLEEKLQPYQEIEIDDESGRRGLHSIKIIKPRRVNEYIVFSQKMYQAHAVEGPPHVALAWKRIIDWIQ